ncbi:hypothetical protein D3C85_469060 [compost metagenome]
MNTCDLLFVEDEIQTLRTDLFMARLTILELMSEPAKNALEGFSGCRSLEEVQRWERNAIEKLLSLVQTSAGERHSLLEGAQRVSCPLCKKSRQGNHGSMGFTFPRGLRRHFAGTHNSYQCPVFEATLGLCRQFFTR